MGNKEEDRVEDDCQFTYPNGLKGLEKLMDNYIFSPKGVGRGNCGERSKEDHEFIYKTTA